MPTSIHQKQSDNNSNQNINSNANIHFSDNEEMNIRQYLDIILAGKWIIILSLFIAIIIGSFKSLNQIPMYE
ncbi:MAG: hypothetical protein R8K21_06325, partial [Mariprofundales bacterium]